MRHMLGETGLDLGDLFQACSFRLMGVSRVKFFFCQLLEIPGHPQIVLNELGAGYTGDQKPLTLINSISCMPSYRQWDELRWFISCVVRVVVYGSADVYCRVWATGFVRELLGLA